MTVRTSSSPGVYRTSGGGADSGGVNASSVAEASLMRSTRNTRSAAAVRQNADSYQLPLAENTEHGATDRSVVLPLPNAV